MAEDGIERMKLKAEGVWIAAPGIVHWTAEDIAFVEREALNTAKRRARICAHEDSDRMHQMLIAFCADSVNPMHAHERPESLLLLKGRMVVHFEAGETRFLFPFDYLRIPAGVRHQPMPVTDCVILESAEK